jgi:hypothetical protein
MLGIREVGGRDPNERPDNQNHPGDALDGVAISLTSANARPKKEHPSVVDNDGREQYRRHPITRAVMTSEVLVMAAVALLVAVPAVCCYNFLIARMEVLNIEMRNRPSEVLTLHRRYLAKYRGYTVRRQKL